MTRPLPKAVEETLVVLYEHFRRTGQRRYWEIEGDENDALLREHEHTDLYELALWQGKRRILLSGKGIDFVRSRYPLLGSDEVPRRAPVHYAEAVAMPGPGSPPRRLTPERLLDALRQEIQRRGDDSQEELLRQIDVLWRAPGFHSALRSALEHLDERR